MLIQYIAPVCKQKIAQQLSKKPLLDDRHKQTYNCTTSQPLCKAQHSAASDASGKIQQLIAKMQM